MFDFLFGAISSFFKVDWTYIGMQKKFSKKQNTSTSISNIFNEINNQYFLYINISIYGKYKLNYCLKNEN